MQQFAYTDKRKRPLRAITSSIGRRNERFRFVCDGVGKTKGLSTSSWPGEKTLTFWNHSRGEEHRRSLEEAILQAVGRTEDSLEGILTAP